MYMLMDIQPGRHRHSVADARRNLPSLIRAAEDGDTVEISRRGVSVAVLISSKRFAQLGPKRPSFMDAYRAFARKTDLAALALDPDEIFGGIRDVAPGREVEL